MLAGCVRDHVGREVHPHHGSLRNSVRDARRGASIAAANVEHDIVGAKVDQREQLTRPDFLATGVLSVIFGIPGVHERASGCALKESMPGATRARDGGWRRRRHRSRWPAAGMLGASNGGDRFQITPAAGRPANGPTAAGPLRAGPGRSVCKSRAGAGPRARSAVWC